LFRADHVPELLDESEWVASLLESCDAGAEAGTYIPRRSELQRWAKTKGKKLAPGLAIVRQPELIAGIAEDEHDGPVLLTVVSSPRAVTGVVPPSPGGAGDSTDPRKLNLILDTGAG